METKEYATKLDVAKMLRVSKRQVAVLMGRGLPFTRLGHKTVLFDLDAVREWVNSQ